jgi:hypothetical protein
MNSLADAIVHQNLSVLTRGQHPAAQRLALGRAQHLPPFLVECWRLRIPETWDSRGYAYPKDKPIEELVYTPQNAQYYAAFGAVIFGSTTSCAMTRASAQYKGLDGLKDYILNGRAARLGASAAGPLVRSTDELAAFTERYRVPTFTAATLTPGQHLPRRHRARRRLDQQQGRAGRLRHRRGALQGLHLVEGQPHPRHQRHPR